MADTHRVQLFLAKASLQPPLRLTRLTEPPAQDFQPFNTINRDAARQLLVQQRTSDPNYKAPDQQKRHIFRSKEQKAEASNTSHWKFTKHEVAKAFDALLSQATLPPAGVAQALLLHSTLTSLNELWGHLHDEQLEKKMKKNRMSLSLGFDAHEMTWLDKATAHDNFNYIHLLCQTQASQAVLNRALDVALSKPSLQAMKLLLSFGAMAVGYQESINQHIRTRNLDLVSLLLSAPNSVEPEAWKTCLEQEFARAEAGEDLSLSLVLLLLSNQPGLVSESFLLGALRLCNFQAAAIVLGYASSNQAFFSVRHQACELVSQYQDDNLRLSFLNLLSQSGLVGDNLVTREELMKDVLARHFPLVNLLVQAGVMVDVPPHNALQYVVSRLDFAMLEVLRLGTFSSPPAQTLNHLPEDIPEMDMIYFMNLFGYMGLSGQSLNSRLVRAAQKKQRRLVETLLHYGASVEYEEAAAIRAVLLSVDLEMLGLLLQKDCTPAILSPTVHIAVSISPRPARLDAMKALIAKGVERPPLGAALQYLMREDDEIDSTLLKLLLDNGAPLDYSIDVEDSPLVQASKRGDVAVLNMLCGANPTSDALAAALPLAFNTIAEFGYEIALDIMTLLLKQGASGPVVDKLLLTTIESGVRLEFVRVLIEHGADVNYSCGGAFAKAIETNSLPLLELLCSSSPPSQTTVNAILPKIVDPKHYNLATLELFLTASSRASPKPALRNVYALIKDHEHGAEILPCLLRHGLDVNEEDGIVLRLVVREQNMDLVNEILSFDPNVATLSNAFEEASQIEESEIRLELMKRLLEKASPAEIGQSKALLQETKAAMKGGMDGLWLLMGHKADVNFNNGEAVQAAASTGAGYPIILNMLLSAGATNKTVEEAFDAASSADTPPSIKAGIFGSLLAFTKEISTEVVSRALVFVFEKHPEDEHLPTILLEHNAQVGIEMLKAAANDSPGGLFQKLIQRIADYTTRNSIFEHLQTSTSMETEHRKQAYETLLKQGLWQSQISEALLVSIKNDPSNLEIPKLLLDNGARVNYKDNAAFAAAFQSRNLEMFELLCCYLVKDEDDEAANLVFNHPYLRRNLAADQAIRAKIYKSVLAFNIEKKSIYNALVHSLESKQSYLPIVELLLENGADPNEGEGHCFYLAASNNLESHFRALCKYAALSIVLPTLLRRLTTEDHVTRWFTICFEIQKSQVENGLSDQLLFQCIRKFTQGTTLLSLLLNAGLSPAVTIMWRLPGPWEEEEIPLLVWSMVSRLGIGNQVMLRLLKEDKGKFKSTKFYRKKANNIIAMPNLVTPESKIPIIFLALLEKKRAPVLEALLNLNSEIVNETISGSMFSSLAAPASTNSKSEFSTLFEEDDEISPREASLFLGNLDAFKLLNKSITPDDGTLHLASLLALPDFVQWLLQTHEPNYEEENFGFMVPLALTCYSKPFPWCKVANDHKHWFPRLEETMRILIPETSTGWRYRQKLPLHLALENGSQVTEALLRALEVKDAGSRDKYLYADKTAMFYSPREYVDTFVEVEEEEKNKLVRVLEKHGLH
ncbi:hypothetical protein F53441_115 [Fusarium austroafricanum]|uniref:Ankyrin repeat protein n=1 Tax=Fusarium austroafricanum TaxID=2364996 RepID=A0A8H4KVN0_9HYPO|nr:hypothetical protein F53441_115 [Fusarium austroafricanum]